MKIVFFGTPQFAVTTLVKLRENPDIEVVAVVTQPDKRRGRGNKTLPSAVKKVALEHNLPVWQPPKIKKDPETLDLLRKTKVDAFVVVAYGQILSEEILSMPKLGCINVHGSLLPQYRGAAPIQWSIVNGDRTTGITTMLMDRGMDTGDILLKAETEIKLLDNAVDLAVTLADRGADLLLETLFKLEQKEINPIPQSDSLATYARLIDKADFAIDWSQSALEIHNRVRGFFPNCAAKLDDKKLKVIATVPITETTVKDLPAEYRILQQQYSELNQIESKPGEIVKNIKNLGALVQTGSGFLLLTQVQLAGKRTQSGWDFVNGMRIVPGTKISNG
ncbi:methionyl-tRNA formyltransferase [Waterburya agarophytonicola K14]|uniref:Methionyl-tRNA formyltransferase n=1 Tax=Waterburya agarophytonicola KI4 TaxID=2874699 RepID=A0A964BN13_9CYAN|nr:methionyl-tRNA formyltransferase [Waterburya agarophytonicola]MCC0176479.1 methionyl-tRNA formyltransferase [Waterburya agarophytonicola KI4]